MKFVWPHRRATPVGQSLLGLGIGKEMQSSGSGSGSGRYLAGGWAVWAHSPPALCFVHSEGEIEREGSWKSHRLLPCLRALTVRSNTAINSLEASYYRESLRAVRAVHECIALSPEDGTNNGLALHSSATSRGGDIWSCGTRGTAE